MKSGLLLSNTYIDYQFLLEVLLEYHAISESDEITNGNISEVATGQTYNTK